MLFYPTDSILMLFYPLEKVKISEKLHFIGLYAVINSVNGMSGAKTVDYSITCKKDLKVFADPDRLKQILINIIGNIVKNLVELHGGTIYANSETGNRSDTF